jgi:hypothetical protein
MTIKQIMDDVQHPIHVSSPKRGDGYWIAWIDPIDNPTPGATRFPFQYEGGGETRGQAIKNLYEALKGQNGLVRLNSELNQQQDRGTK